MRTQMLVPDTPNIEFAVLSALSAAFEVERTRLICTVPPCRNPQTTYRRLRFARESKLTHGVRASSHDSGVESGDGNRRM